jgi:indole-3-glycerol phosphate synthase
MLHNKLRKMNILERIVESKRAEVAERKREMPEARLKKEAGFSRSCNSLKAALLTGGSSGVIAEFKKKSPSRGLIHASARVEEVTKAYVEAGAAGLSVLTDHIYFGGTLSDLVKAREANSTVPILRKDFMIDPYQVTEAKAFGADVILLIAACLEKEEAVTLAKQAKSLGMEVLMEIHRMEELDKLNEYVDIVGVNNRNLEIMKVDVNTSVRLAPNIPGKFVKISESGLKDARTIQFLKENGFRGFLIGETFMQTENPGDTCREFISGLKNKSGT